MDALFLLKRFHLLKWKKPFNYIFAEVNGMEIENILSQKMLHDLKQMRIKFIKHNFPSLSWMQIKIWKKLSNNVVIPNQIISNHSVHLIFSRFFPNRKNFSFSLFVSMYFWQTFSAEKLVIVKEDYVLIHKLNSIQLSRSS